jgi:PAS domain S-box-containing protein
MQAIVDYPWEAIFNSIADGVFTVDLDWNITFFNDAASRIIGIPRERAMGRKCWDVFHSSLCDGACVLKTCMAEGGRMANRSVYFIRPGGEKVAVSISAAPLKDASGTLIGGVETFRDLTDLHLMRRRLENAYSFDDVVGKSQSLAKIFAWLPLVAKSQSSVLILGESGTGKELFAKAVHTLSNRKDGPYVAVNCAALPDTLLEAELFGYKAGAFTDARRDKPGRFHLARGGTLFLDEIGDMPLRLQAKLLRVLQEKRFEPLGGVKSEVADVRVVAATNRELEVLVKAGAFRQDLFYRLNVATMRLPPLRERVEDIPLLASHFIQEQNAVQGKNVTGLSPQVTAILMRHNYPGNVRELKNILEFAFILCQDGSILPEHLPEQLRPQGREGALPARARTLDEIKRDAVIRAIQRNQGKRMAACRELGISKDTMRRILGTEQGEK